MVKFFLVLAGVFLFANHGSAQVRSDFETVEDYDNFLLRNMPHAFAGDSRPVIVNDSTFFPYVNWWKVLCDSCANNERGLPDPLSLDEKQRMEIYRMQDSVGRKSAEEGKAFLEELEKSSPNEALKLSQESSLFHANVDIARQENQSRVEALPTLFDKEQQRELRKIASARLHASVNLFALINRLCREKELDLTPAELKRFREQLQEVNAELSLEMTRLRAKAWDDVLGALDRETREKLESKMLLNEIK